MLLCYQAFRSCICLPARQTIAPAMLWSKKDIQLHLGHVAGSETSLRMRRHQLPSRRPGKAGQQHWEHARPHIGTPKNIKLVV